MGLDMYMTVNDRKTGETIKNLYWRKFNALHWYIDDTYGIDSNELWSVNLGREDMEDLIVRMEKIKSNLPKAIKHQEATEDTMAYTEFEAITDKQKELYAEQLPFCSWFFFWTYDYDDYYLSCVLDTLEKFKELEPYFDTADFIYEASR